jgi:hypothetical protein
MPRKPSSDTVGRVSFSYRLTPELRHKIELEALKQGALRGQAVSMNDLITEFCEKGLAELEKRKK